MDKLLKTINMGTLRKRNDNILELSIVAKKDVESLITQLLPYLIIKKPQANLILEILKKQKFIKTDQEFIEVCKLIDKFEILNDSKKRTNRADIVEKELITPVET